MLLNSIGEFGFIERFKPMFSHLLNSGQTGIGDDCAIIPVNEKEEWLVTTDLLVEGVHFLKDAISPYQLGVKSMAVNLSDIAAMGGTPTGAFLSIAIPKDTEVEYLDELMKGIHSVAERYSVPLMGGDTTKSLQHLAINVCVIGKCEKGKARRRGMAKMGDLICVSGNLGDSAAGLEAVLNKFPKTPAITALIDKHHTPTPRIEEGALLSSYAGVHAMMDLSDGVASDLPHILKASGCGAIIEVSHLPISDELRSAAEEYGWDCLSMAAAGGEDYELLCTIAPSDFDAVNEAFKSNFSKELSTIGFITGGASCIKWLDNGEEFNLSNVGFQHF